MQRWLPALTGMACLGLGAGMIGVYGFFVDDLAQEFSVGVAQINMGPVALLLVPGLVAPFVGKLADRLPIRRIILAGVSFAMLSLCLVSKAPSLWLAALGFVGFSLGLTCYGPVVINGLMVKLYPGREARALAIAAMGISLATAVLPPITGVLLALYDWRSALAILALGLWGILVVVVMAGIPADSGAAPSVASRQAGREIYRHRHFWLIGFCVALGLNHSIILAICYPLHFMSQGYSVAEAGWFLSLAGSAGLLGKIGVAWLGDAGRAWARWVAASLLLVQVLGLLMLLASDSVAAVVLGVSLLGFGGGGFLPMQAWLNSRYYDAAIIAQVSGAQMPLFLPLGLIGPPLAGYVFDQQGNYQWVLLGLVAVLLVAAVLAALLPRPIEDGA